MLDDFFQITVITHRMENERIKMHTHVLLSLFAQTLSLVRVPVS